jgi:hypothetical protein
MTPSDQIRRDIKGEDNIEQECPMLRASLVIAAISLALVGCEMASVATGETRHETKTIELDKVEMARVEIRMGAGELRVQSGTPKLLEANFAYNVPDWKPVVDYKAGAAGGDLTVSQPGNPGSFGNTVNTWELKLNGQLPMEVTANLGAGEANLVIGQMNLRNVIINVGVGEVTVDLRGEPRRDYSVQVRGGVGQATVYLPKDAGISAMASGGMGDIRAEGLEKRDGVWINPDKLNAPVTVRLDVKGGIGEIRLVR